MLLQKLNKSRGFTMIEVLICIAILAIAAAIFVPLVATFLDSEISETPPSLTIEVDPDEGDPVEPKTENKGELNKL